MNIPTPPQVRETVHRSLDLLETLITLGEEKVTTFCDSLSSDLYEEAKTLMKELCDEPDADGFMPFIRE